MIYFCKEIKKFESFYYCSTFHFGIPPVLAFQLEVYNKVDRLLTVLPTQQQGTTARSYSNKTSLIYNILMVNFVLYLQKSTMTFLQMTLHSSACKNVTFKVFRTAFY